MGRVKVLPAKLSHSAENFPRRESFGVPLFLGIEKVSIRKGGERIKVFCQKIFVSQCERFRRQPFCAVIQKLRMREGEHQVFPFFLFHGAETANV